MPFAQGAAIHAFDAEQWRVTGRRAAGLVLGQLFGVEAEPQACSSSISSMSAPLRALIRSCGVLLIGRWLLYGRLLATETAQLV